MTRPLLGAMRSHGCGTLRAGASGVVQVVVHPDQAQAPAIRAEDCVRVAGTVRARPAGNENPELPSGEVEAAAADTRCWPLRATIRRVLEERAFLGGRDPVPDQVDPREGRATSSSPPTWPLASSTPCPSPPSCSSSC
jgi:hypothetical protein